MPRKTTDNPELMAMIGIEELLSPLTDAGQARVLRWAAETYAHVLAGGRPERVSDAVLAGSLGEPLDGRPVGAAIGNAGDPRRDEP